MATAGITPIRDQNVLEDETLNLQALPEPILIEIFNHSNLADIKSLSFVCRRFKILSDKENLWQMIAAKHGFFDKIDGYNWKKSYFLHLQQRVNKLMDKMLCYREYALVELAKAIPSRENIEKVNVLVNQGICSIRIGIDCTDIAKAQLEFTKAFPSEENFEKVRKLIEGIILDWQRAYAQIEFTKAFPSRENIKRTNKFIDEIKTDNSLKARAQIELFKIVPSSENLKKAEKIIDQITLAELKDHAQFLFIIALFTTDIKDNIEKEISFLDQFKFIKAFFITDKNENNIEKGIKLLDQLTNPFKKALAQITLFEVIFSDENVEKAYQLIDQITDRYYSDSARLQLLKALIRFSKIDKARELIDKIYDREFKAQAQIELVRAIPSKENIEKAKKIIEEFDEGFYISQEPFNKAQCLIELIKIVPSGEAFEKAIKLIDIIDERLQRDNIHRALHNLIKAYLQ